jgi:hypothetical protein
MIRIARIHKINGRIWIDVCEKNGDGLLMPYHLFDVDEVIIEKDVMVKEEGKNG